MKLELIDIIPNDFLISITNSLTYSTGLGIAFIDREGHHVGSQDNFCRFCAKINSTPEGICACEESNKKGMNVAEQTRKSVIYTCHAGLTSIVVPMMYENECLGAISAGQVFCDESENYPHFLTEHPISWENDDELKKCYDQIPTLGKLQVESAVIAFQCISNYIVQQVAYNKMCQELLETQTKQLKLESQLKLAELNALQKQIMPHFLFNVLGGVVRLLDGDRIETAKSMLVSFTKMMRYTLTDAATSVSLADELGYIKNYLNIQKIRFATKINYSIDCREEFDALRVPFFGIQPLVENAIEHGLLAKPDGGIMLISCSRLGNRITISVEDNGNGVPKEHLEKMREAVKPDSISCIHNHVGLYNSSHRFYYMYDQSVSYSIDSFPGIGTTVKIILSEPKFS